MDLRDRYNVPMNPLYRISCVNSFLLLMAPGKPRKFATKTPGSKLDPERVHWGQTPFQINDDPEISQLDAEYDPELGQSDPIVCQVCRELTDFRVIVDPEWSLAPMDPFPGHADPGVFRVQMTNHWTAETTL